MARPCKLTAEVQQRICNFLRQGVYRDTAVLASRVGLSTFYRWMEQGVDQVVERDGRKVRIKAKRLFRDFRDAVEQADAEAEAMCVATVRSAAYELTRGADGNPVIRVKDWRAAAFILERKFGKRWAQFVDPELAEPIAAAAAASGVRRREVFFGGRYLEDGSLQKPAVQTAARQIPEVIDVPPTPDRDSTETHRLEPHESAADDDAVRGGELAPRPNVPDV